MRNILKLWSTSGHYVNDDNGQLKFDGEIAEWSCDPDLWSYFGIVAFAKELGHMDVKELWYSLGGHSMDLDRLELLTDDRGVMHMLNIARLNDEVHLYVVHNMMEPKIIQMIDWVSDGEVRTEMVEGKGEAHEGDGEVHTEVGTKMVEGEGDAHEGDEEAEVHEVHDFELEDLGEDDDVENSEGEDVHEAETEDEDVDYEVDVSEESLIDVNIQCDIRTSKGNVRQEPSSPVRESSQSTYR
ncbi:hypothetical protein V8G54_002151 [Vigna mungo]|uniref:PB1-like domain-containing protein n=1 Tax=Vigna mungo TaxID=3915 RepID=A0AAQ3P9V8_VIGMU